MILTRKELFELMKGDLYGDTIKKVEQHVSTRLQSTFILSDEGRKNVHRDASKIREKWTAVVTDLKKFLKNHEDWLQVFFELIK